ncbi:MAG: uroporphyrinogen-III C-methyltransferase [Gallionella sp.]
MNDQPPNDKQSPQQADGQDATAKPTPEHDTRNTDFFSRISITQLTLVIMVVLFMWQWLEGRRIVDDIQQQLAKKIDEMDNSSKANRQLLTQSQDQVNELSIKMATLETRYAELQNQRGTQGNMNNDLSVSRDETALAEVEQMLLNAAQQLQTSANVRAALIFMQSADARVQRMNRPASRDLSGIIGRDMDKLRALPVVDITGINRQLNKLIAAVDGLPLAYQQRTADEKLLMEPLAIRLGEQTTPAKSLVMSGHPSVPNTKPPQGERRDVPDGVAVTPQVVSPEDETRGERLLREIWQEMKQLVEIENTGRDEIPLLHPDQQFFLRENLKLRLLSARIALLSRDEIVFRQELKNTQLWTARYFDTKSPAVSEVLAGMKKLAASRISIELPDLSSSLQAVRNYRLRTEKAAR